MPSRTVHTILRNRLYTGEFDCNGVTYQGTYEADRLGELWEQVQDVLDGRHRETSEEAERTISPSRGLIACGQCGCALVGEIKKGAYVYYHCTGYKGKCPEPYTREEVLEKKFTALLLRDLVQRRGTGLGDDRLRESHAR